jgi:hypothetical protein
VKVSVRRIRKGRAHQEVLPSTLPFAKSWERLGGWSIVILTDTTEPVAFASNREEVGRNHCEQNMGQVFPT